MANPKYAVSDKPVPVSELVATLSDGTKVKRRVPRMRACNEKDAKGKLCAGPPGPALRAMESAKPMG